jgi:para-nitrobenzyl esterase
MKAAKHEASSRVETRCGTLEGFVESGVHKFHGIPYAKPPIGDLRWRAPAPVTPWAGVRQAKTFGPASVQTVGAVFDLRVDEQSEDCLYLNVWTTDLSAAASRPVMVFIHGGGNLGGAGSEDCYDGTHLARKGVTAVTFNYRLGALGFLAHPTVGANFAVLDYVAALEWVRDNIGAFGGDPGNVTVYGQSAGALAARTLLSCGAARGLFHRAILQSAGFGPPAFAKSWSYERAQQAAEALFDRLGSRDLAVLRAAPIAEVKLASHELCGIFPKPGHVHTPANLVWMPVIDNTTVMESPLPAGPGEMPLLLGCVENEARFFLKPGNVYPRQVLENMARQLCGPKADEILASLDAEKLDTYDALDRLFTTIMWTEPAWETVRTLTARGRPFYYYQFKRLSPGAIASRELAKHTAELRYVFGNLPDDAGYDAVDRHVSELVRDAWIAFARDGVPESPQGLPWPRCDADAPFAAIIRDAVTVEPFPTNRIIQIVNSMRR